MKYLIWYSSKSGCYNHGSEMDYKVNASLTGEELEVLYELDESEIDGGDFGPYKQSERLDIYKNYYLEYPIIILESKKRCLKKKQILIHLR